ncbi:gliding motility-associated C-terminal domain-containing protein [Chryseolinea sp. T2]|uniref:DUF7948 domain-containing protein n=1 Tax=Chryseolinea sp. T2 TaxID=3129255 RepID=UPI00307869BB
MNLVFRNCMAIVLLFGFSLLRHAAVADPGKGLKFIENKSQWNVSYDYGATIPGGSFFVQPGAFTFVFLNAEQIEQGHERIHHSNAANEGCDLVDGVRIMTHFLGANNAASVKPISQNSDYANYFIGADEKTWASNVRNYQALLYQSLYPGIDMKVYSEDHNLKYDFVVEAGADPSVIRFSYKGIDDVSMNALGDLEVSAGWPLFIEKKPVAYQYVNGKRVLVPCHYELLDGVVSFQFPEGYDACHPLTIDPLLIFSTYSGSTADNWGSTATPGEHGTLYSAGVTWKNPRLQNAGVFPATPGAFQVALGGVFDIGILKYDSTGTRLLYATYLGGQDTDSPHSLVVNSSNELLVLGTTSSLDYPTTETAYDREFSGGTEADGVVEYVNGTDILISKLSSDGRQLLASTLLGGPDNDGLNEGILVKNYGDQQRGDIITDPAGNVYVATVTQSDEFPIVNGLHNTFGGGVTDAVLVKLNPDLSSIIWSTFIGGSGADACHTIKFDKNGDLFVAGGTSSPNFPVTAGSYQSVFNGVADGWIASLTSDGTTWQRSTFTGTASFDEVFFVDLNADDEVYVFGQTSGAFPVTAGVYNNPNSGQFIQKFNHNLTQLTFSTVIGSGRGIPDISPTAFLVNDCNNIYIAGWGGVVNMQQPYAWKNNTIGMPTTSDAYQSHTSGSDFYFMVLTDDATEFLYGTYLGGNLSRTHVDGGTSRFDKSGVVYQAVCAGCEAYNASGHATSDFPTTQGAWSNVNRSGNCNNAAFKFDLSSLKARLQSNSIQLNQPGLSKVCIPDPIVFQNFSTGGETFEWDLGDGTKLVKPDTSMVVHQYKTTGLYTVWLKAIDKGTCKVKDSASVKLNVYIADIRIQEDDNMCLNVPYTLHASGGVSYFWRSQDNTFQSNEQNPTVLPNDTTLYIVRVTERSGCIKEDSVQLKVIPTIVPTFDMDQSAECFNRPTLHAVSTTDSLWTDDRIYFDFGDGTTSDNGEVTHNYEKDGLFNFKLVLVRNECVTEKILPVPVFQLKIPNVITPGKKDAANDNFVIQYGPVAGVSPAQYGFKTSVTIYNRWGVKVYHSDDYQNDWDGDGIEGGVYYYEITVQDHATCKSWLHVIK